VSLHLRRTFSCFISGYQRELHASRSRILRKKILDLEFYVNYPDAGNKQTNGKPENITSFLGEGVSE